MVRDYVIVNLANRPRTKNAACSTRYANQIGEAAANCLNCKQTLAVGARIQAVIAARVVCHAHAARARHGVVDAGLQLDAVRGTGGLRVRFHQRAFWWAMHVLPDMVGGVAHQTMAHHDIDCTVKPCGWRTTARHPAAPDGSVIATGAIESQATMKNRIAVSPHMQCVLRCLAIWLYSGSAFIPAFTAEHVLVRHDNCEDVGHHN